MASEAARTPVVVLTRGGPPDALEAALRAAGLDVRRLEVTRPAPTGAALPPRADRIVFTSAAAVAFAGAARPIPAACVGAATAAAARAAGWTVDLVSEGTGADLAHGLGPRRGQTLLWPRARDAAPETGPALRSTGATVVEVEVYALEPAPALPERLAGALPADLIALLSPAAARLVRSAAGPLVLPPAVALGPTTAAAAQGYELRAVAAAPTPEALTAAALAALS